MLPLMRSGAGAPTRPAGRSPASPGSAAMLNLTNSARRTSASEPECFLEAEQFAKITSNPARLKILAASRLVWASTVAERLRRQWVNS